MRALICRSVFMVSTFIFAGSACWTQQSPNLVQPAKVSVDLGFTFAGERSKPDPSLCCFWFKGGGVDAAVTFWKGFGIAAALTGDHASDYLLSTDENKVSFLVGPRYTFAAWKKQSKGEDLRQLQFFGQGLVGVAHSFDTRFSNGSTSANELAIQAGGGLNFNLTRKFGIRPIQVDFVRTQIGATGFSTQNDMRLAAGLTYTLQTARPRLFTWRAHPAR